MNINEESKYYVSMCVPQDQENGKGQIGRLTRSLWFNVPKVTAYRYCNYAGVISTILRIIFCRSSVNFCMNGIG